MIAKKCDRCGKYYDYYSGIPLNQDMKKRFKLGAANELKLFSISSNGLNVDFTILIDLCPECMTELLEWMRGRDAE